MIQLGISWLSKELERACEYTGNEKTESSYLIKKTKVFHGFIYSPVKEIAIL